MYVYIYIRIHIHIYIYLDIDTYTYINGFSFAMVDYWTVSPKSTGYSSHQIPLLSVLNLLPNYGRHTHMPMLPMFYVYVVPRFLAEFPWKPGGICFNDFLQVMYCHSTKNWSLRISQLHRIPIADKSPPGWWFGTFSIFPLYWVSIHAN